MPARTLNDFLAGFFYGQSGDIKMANTRQNDRRKGIRKEANQEEIILKQSRLNVKGTKNKR